MPLYQYQCSDCEHTFKKMRQMNHRKEPCNKPCPECGGEHVNFVIGTPQVAYNQPGLHRTSEDFNSRLKEIREGVPASAKQNLDNVIR